MALAGVRQRALGQPLPAPVEDRDREAAGARIAHHLEIFLDELRAAGKHAQRPLAARPAARSAQSAAPPRRRSSRFRRSRLREPDWREWRSSFMGNRRENRPPYSRGFAANGGFPAS